MNNILSVFLTNLGKYNEGFLIGEWVNLPIGEAELEKVMERIGIDDEFYEETFLTDWESPIRALHRLVGEYSSIEDLNEIVEELENISDDDVDVLNAIYDSVGNFDTMLQVYKNGDYRIYQNCYKMEDVAREYLNEIGAFYGLPDFVEIYFDFESYGRDMAIEGWFSELDDGTIIQVYC